MKSEELIAVAGLLRGQRQATLGTLGEGGPFVSMVGYAVEPGFAGVLLHLSGLAAHTRHLRADPRAALLVCEPDGPQVEDVQTLARITLTGLAVPIPPDAPDYTVARVRYLARLPAAAPLFDLPDFALFRLTPSEARYVGGFARAATLTPEQLRAAAEAAEAAETAGV